MVIKTGRWHQMREHLDHRGGVPSPSAPCNVISNTSHGHRLPSGPQYTDQLKKKVKRFQSEGDVGFGDGNLLQSSLLLFRYHHHSSAP